MWLVAVKALATTAATTAKAKRVSGGDGCALVARVAETIFRYNMLPPGSRVGVAVSGGADSMCLLHVLHELAGSRGWQLTVLHLNHGLRGAESQADARLVRETAARLGWPCLVERARGLAAPNLEEKSREARYRFFARMSKRHKLDRIATAHTLGDQAETVLLRMIRGAGPSGLAAIACVTESGIVRPLIETQRPSIEAWLGARGVAWREDASNQDVAFDRNRVRHLLLPLLEKEFNPEIAANLSRLAELSAAEEQFWSRWVAAELRTAARPLGTGRLVLDAAHVSRLDPAQQRRLLRGAIEAAKGSLRQVDQVHIFHLARLCNATKGSGSVEIPGLVAVRSFGDVLLTKRGSAGGQTVFNITVPRAGRVRLPPGLGAIRIAATQPPSSTRYNGDAGSIFPNGWGAPWVLRSWRPGDAYRPTGYPRRQKLKDLFQRHKVPSWDRLGWPIIEKEGRIVWSRRFGLAVEVESALVVEDEFAAR